jgi:hypothetical protein
MKEVFGGIIMAIGILIAGGSGLCSLVMLFSGDGEFGNTMEMLPLVLVVGGVPFAIGSAITFGGYMLFRSGRDDRDPDREQEQ